LSICLLEVSLVGKAVFFLVPELFCLLFTDFDGFLAVFCFESVLNLLLAGFTSDKRIRGADLLKKAVESVRSLVMLAVKQIFLLSASLLVSLDESDDFLIYNIKGYLLDFVILC
jgi:hypothetical protein